MNKRLIATCIVIFVIVISAALVSSLLGRGQFDATANAIVFPDDIKHEHFDWFSVLTTMPIYQTDKKDKKPQVAAKVISLSDAKLVAIVSDSPKTAMLLTPESQSLSPLAIKIGEGWLENWTLKTINTDHVVWQSSVSNDTHTQYLYE